MANPLSLYHHLFYSETEWSPMEYLSQNTWIHLIDVVIFWDQILLFIQVCWLKLSIMWCFNTGFQGSRIWPPVRSHSRVCSKHIQILPLPNQTRNISRTEKKRDIFPFSPELKNRNFCTKSCWELHPGWICISSTENNCVVLCNPHINTYIHKFTEKLSCRLKTKPWKSSENRNMQHTAAWFPSVRKSTL